MSIGIRSAEWSRVIVPREMFLHRTNRRKNRTVSFDEIAKLILPFSEV